MLTKFYENTYFVRKKSHKLLVKQVYVLFGVTYGHRPIVEKVSSVGTVT